jgi:hypothetical protein
VREENRGSVVFNGEIRFTRCEIRVKNGVVGNRDEMRVASDERRNWLARYGNGLSLVFSRKGIIVLYG